jgi:hypothetical protein
MQCVSSEYRAIEIVLNDPRVLDLPVNRVNGAFIAWKSRLQSEKDAVILITRAPKLLSHDPTAIVEADGNLVTLAFLYSYFAAWGRLLKRSL